LRNASGCDASRGLACGGAFEHVARIREVPLQGSGKVGVSGARRGNGLVLCGVSGTDGENFGPVLPVAILDFNGDGRTNCFAVPHAAEKMGSVGLDAHAAAAAISLL